VYLLTSKRFPFWSARYTWLRFVFDQSLIIKGRTERDELDQIETGGKKLELHFLRAVGGGAQPWVSAVLIGGGFKKRSMVATGDHQLALLSFLFMDHDEEEEELRGLDGLGLRGKSSSCSLSSLLVPVLLGQGLSIMLTATGVFSEALSRNEGISAPALQNLLVYLTLAAVFGLTFLMRDQTQFCLKVSWQVYAIVALADFLGNFFAVLAFRFTSIANVTLLDCFAIPMVMILSRFYFKTSYRMKNIAGILACLIGIVIIVSSDSSDSASSLKGDFFAIVASIFYATSNVMQEALVKRFDREEFLFMLGMFGSLYACVVTLSTESEVLMHDSWSPKSFAYFFGYLISLFSIYVSVSRFLQDHDAAFLNISLLSSDIFAVFAGMVFFGDDFGVSYVVALIAIISGVLLYNSERPEN